MTSSINIPKENPTFLVGLFTFKSSETLFVQLLDIATRVGIYRIALRLRLFRLQPKLKVLLQSSSKLIT